MKHSQANYFYSPWIAGKGFISLLTVLTNKQELLNNPTIHNSYRKDHSVRYVSYDPYVLLSPHCEAS